MQAGNFCNDLRNSAATAFIAAPVTAAPVTVAAGDPQSTPRDTTTCSCHSGTAFNTKPNVACRQKLHMYV